MELGEKLREARIEQGLSIDDIQKETKIQKRYLESLENNDWSSMPGNFYVRAFVREYATAVGLDGDALLEEHTDELPSTSDKQYEYITSSRSSRTSSGSSPIFKFLPKLLVVVLVVAILFAIYYAVINFIEPGSSNNNSVDDNQVVTPPEDDQEDVTEEPPEENNEPEEQKPEEEEEVTEPSLNLVSTDKNNDRVRYKVNLKNSDKFVLEFETNNKTYLWVRALDDNGKVKKSYYEKMFTQKQSPLTVDVSNEQSVEINIGLAVGTTVKINGEPFEYPVDPNEVVHQYITINKVNE